MSLLLTAAAARAAPVHVEIAGQLQLPGQAAAHGFQMQFDLDPLLPGVIAENPQSFRLESVAVQTRVDGSVVSGIAQSVGWFADAAYDYYGVDVRIDDFYQVGDRMQFIVVTSQSLFSGSTAQPVLELLSLANLGGIVCHDPARSGACDYGPLDQASYSAAERGAVPAPSTALLAPLGLLLAGWQRRRRARAAGRDRWTAADRIAAL